MRVVGRVTKDIGYECGCKWCTVKYPSKPKRKKLVKKEVIVEKF